MKTFNGYKFNFQEAFLFWILKGQGLWAMTYYFPYLLCNDYRDYPGKYFDNLILLVILPPFHFLKQFSKCDHIPSFLLPSYRGEFTIKYQMLLSCLKLPL